MAINSISLKYLLIALLVYLSKCNNLYEIPINTLNNFYSIQNNIFQVNSDSNTNFICSNSLIQCAGNGICTIDFKDCICNRGFISLNKSFTKCTYQQKSKLVVLLLEILIPLGFGHFYSQNYYYFLIKFILFSLSYCFFYLVLIFTGTINNSNVDEKTYFYTKLSCFILLPIIFLCYLADILVIITNSYTDVNGISLYL